MSAALLARPDMPDCPACDDRGFTRVNVGTARYPDWRTYPCTACTPDPDDERRAS